MCLHLLKYIVILKHQKFSRKTSIGIRWREAILVEVLILCKKEKVLISIGPMQKKLAIFKTCLCKAGSYSCWLWLHQLQQRQQARQWLPYLLCRKNVIVYVASLQTIGFCSKMQRSFHGGIWSSKYGNSISVGGVQGTIGLPSSCNCQCRRC